MNSRSSVARLSDLPAPSRPRERLLRHGPAALTDAELLAIVLRTGTRGCNVVALAQRLLHQFGGLRPLLATDHDQLSNTRGIGPAKAAQLLATLELARRSLAEELARGPVLNRPELVETYCASILAHQKVEVCIALYFDNQLRLITTEETSRGTLAQAAVYPREIVRSALHHHAASVVIAHNHPSGLAEPSRADLELTRHLREALALVDTRLIDHIIVAGKETVSLARLGKL